MERFGEVSPSESIITLSEFQLSPKRMGCSTLLDFSDVAVVERRDHNRESDWHIMIRVIL